MEKPHIYSVTRERAANVSYQEIERRALDLLAEGQRPRSRSSAMDYRTSGADGA